MITTCAFGLIEFFAGGVLRRLKQALLLHLLHRRGSIPFDRFARDIRFTQAIVDIPGTSEDVMAQHYAQGVAPLPADVAADIFS